MRNILLALFLAFAVILGGSHASASAHDHGSTHAEAEHSLQHSDEVEDADENDRVDSQSKEVAHSHVTMGAILDGRNGADRFSKNASLLPIRAAQALPSLGSAPPLEPPSA